MNTIRQLPSSDYKSELWEIEISHPGGEKKFIPIETVHEKWIAVRWGMSGIYDIHLDTGSMISRSAAARRKGQCIWKVSNLSEARAFMRSYLKLDEKEETEKRMKHHAQSMPGARKIDGYVFPGTVRNSNGKK